MPSVPLAMRLAEENIVDKKKVKSSDPSALTESKALIAWNKGTLKHHAST